MMKNKLLVSALGLISVSALPSYATNGDQMIGVTATQWGMGGAVVAAPQDAGTILTNPAGIAELNIKEMRVDMGFGFLNPPRKVNGLESDSDLYMIPSGALAFNVNDRLYLGMGMAGLSGMGVDFPDTAAASGNQAIITTKQFYKIAPGFGYKVNDALSIGAALNIDYQSLALSNPQYTLPQNQVYGLGLSAGLIYKPTDTLRIGASWISEQNMSPFHWNTTQGPIEMTMNGPQQFALGVALTPSPGLLIEADIKHIAFSDVLGNVAVSRPDGYSGSVPANMNFGWENQTVFSLGIQKEIDAKTTVRMGLNYGKSPIGTEDVNTNIGSLAVTEKHLSMGMTRKITDKAQVSVSYMHAFNNSISSTTNTIELEQNIVNLQISYKL